MVSDKQPLKLQGDRLDFRSYRNSKMLDGDEGKPRLIRTIFDRMLKGCNAQSCPEMERAAV